MTIGVLAFASGQSLAAESEGTVLFIAPSRLTIAPGQSIAVIDTSNKSKVARRYDLTVIDEAMSPQGALERVDTFPYSVKHMLRFQPKRFTLQPGEDQTVRIMIVRPHDLADGDYHSHLLFREVPLDEKSEQQLEAERKTAAAEAGKSVSFEIRTLYGVGVPIVVQQGKIVSDINMGEPKLGTTPDGKFRQLTIAFTRSGNAEAVALLTANYVQPGKAPVPAMPQQWVRLYREANTVTRSIPLINLPAGAKGGKIELSLARSETDASKTLKKEITLN